MEKKKFALADAKKASYQALRDDMKDLIKGDSLDKFKKLKPQKMMKVSVASDSKEGLQKGLSKAEQILKAKMGGLDSPLKAEAELLPESESEEECPACAGAGCEECPEHESLESPEEYSSESPESVDELKAKVAELEAKLSKLSPKLS